MAREVEVASTPDRWGLRSRNNNPVIEPELPPQIPLRSSIADRIEADLKASGIKPPLDGETGTSLMARLEDDLNKSPLEATAQYVYDLRFHDLIEMCTSAIGENSERLKIEPYDLATGLSSWAIKLLAKQKAAS